MPELASVSARNPRTGRKKPGAPFPPHPAAERRRPPRSVARLPPRASAATPPSPSRCLSPRLPRSIVRLPPPRASACHQVDLSFDSLGTSRFSSKPEWITPFSPPFHLLNHPQFVTEAKIKLGRPPYLALPGPPPVPVGRMEGKHMVMSAVGIEIGVGLWGCGWGCRPRHRLKECRDQGYIDCISTNLYRYELSSELSSSSLETLPQHHAEHQNQSKQVLSREVLSRGHPCRRRVKSEGGTVQKALVALLLDFAAFVLAGSFYLLEIKSLDVEDMDVVVEPGVGWI